MTDADRQRLAAILGHTRICAIEGCGKPARRRGWCGAHYERWCRHGSPTAGGTPDGAPQVFLSKALSYGGDDCLLWPYSKSKGYGSIYHNGCQRAAHVVICEAVYGPAPSARHQAAHSYNGRACVSPACVNPKHLRWATVNENHADMLLHGTRKRGERHGNSKLTEQDVKSIRAQSYRSEKNLSDEFGVHPVTIRKIRNRKTWAWL